MLVKGAPWDLSCYLENALGYQRIYFEVYLKLRTCLMHAFSANKHFNSKKATLIDYLCIKYACGELLI